MTSERSQGNGTRRRITSSGGTRVLTILVAAGLSLTWGMPSHAYVRPTAIERVSVTPEGNQGNGHSTSAAISTNGRYTAFISYASNLVPGDTNNGGDAFLRDNRSGTIKRVSIATDGSQGEGPGCDGAVNDLFGIDLSSSGRYITFTIPRRCLNFYPPDFVPVPLSQDVFVHDTKTGETELISKAPDGTAANGSSRNPTIDASGRFVAFESDANNLDPKVCGGNAIEDITCEVARLITDRRWQVYVYDRAKDRTKVVSLSSDGDIANGGSRDASISPDGRHVAFTSEADNLVPNDNNQCRDQNDRGGVPSCPDVFFHDVSTGKTELISVGLNGSSADWQSGGEYRREMISADNRYVLFWSGAKNLVPNPSDPPPVEPWESAGAYVRDRKTGRTEKISVDSAGRSTGWPRGGSGLFEGNLTPNGRYATFHEERVETHCGTITGFGLHDRRTGATEMYPRPLEGSTCPSTSTTGGNLTADGRFVVFDSWRTDIVEGDTNEKHDIFLLDRGRATGVGGFGGMPPPKQQDPPDDRICIEGTCIAPGTAVTSPDDTGDLGEVLTERGANLYGASLAYRPQYKDLFAAIELEHMPKVVPGISPIFYALRFEVEGKRYEVRATSLNFGTFGLFDCTDSRPLCTKVTDLKGGYGTTGERVVFSLPSKEIGLDNGGDLSNVVAFSGIGGSLTGATKVLDSVTIK